MAEPQAYVYVVTIGRDHEGEEVTAVLGTEKAADFVWRKYMEDVKVADFMYMYLWPVGQVGDCAHHRIREHAFRPWPEGGADA